MKTTMMARVVAFVITIVFVLGSAIVMVTVFDMDAEGRMPYILAGLAIAIWFGIFNWLKPKNPDGTPKDNPNKTSDPTVPS